MKRLGAVAALVWGAGFSFAVVGCSSDNSAGPGDGGSGDDSSVSTGPGGHDGGGVSQADSSFPSSNDGSTPVTLDGSTPTADGGTPIHPGDGGSSADAGPDPWASPGSDATVPVFTNTLVCFGSGGAGPCSRTVDATASFPSTGTYSKVLMHVTLNCPSNGCDPWDRAGSIDLVQDLGAGKESLIELGRFMTPYGITAGTNSPPAWDIDVTELRPLLVGSVKIRVFIDTWVPQGNAAQYGGGWVVGTTFNMTGGKPAKTPIAVLPIWTWKTSGKEPTQVIYGDPNYPIAQSVPPQTLTLPAGATSFGIRSNITGHGQANLDNCAEFCQRNHTWSVNGAANTALMWRTDCGNFPSQGTYMDPRAGWCPGADVTPWDIDVTQQVGTSGTVTIGYDVDSYLNTCNGLPDGGGLCSGCQVNESCQYNGGDHTQPFYYVNSVLVAFR